MGWSCAMPAEARKACKTKAFANILQQGDDKVLQYSGLRPALLEDLRKTDYNLEPFVKAHIELGKTKKGRPGYQACVDAFVAAKRKVLHALADMVRGTTGESIAAAEQKRQSIIQDTSEAEQHLRASAEHKRKAAECDENAANALASAQNAAVQQGVDLKAGAQGAVDMAFCAHAVGRASVPPDAAAASADAAAPDAAPAAAGAAKTARAPLRCTGAARAAKGAATGAAKGTAEKLAVHSDALHHLPADIRRGAKAGHHSVVHDDAAAGASDPAPPAVPRKLAPAAPLKLAPAAPLKLAPAAPRKLAPAAPLKLAPAAPLKLAPTAPLERAPAGPLKLAPAGPLELAPAAPLERAKPKPWAAGMLKAVSSTEGTAAPVDGHCGADLVLTRPLRIGHDCAGMDALSHVLVKRLGLQVQHDFCSEKDEHRRHFLAANFGIQGICEDLMARDFEDLKRRCPPGEVDLCLMGFPCTSFSGLGKQEGDLTMFHKCCETIRVVQPKAVLFENVENLMKLKDKATGERRVRNEVLETLGKIAEDFGYHLTHSVLNTADHGLPHSRPRVFFLLVKREYWQKNYAFQWPAPIGCPAIERLLDGQALPPLELEGLKPDCATGRKVYDNVMTWIAQKAGDDAALQGPWLFNSGEQRSKSAMLGKSPCFKRSCGTQDVWITNRGRHMHVQERARLQGYHLHELRGSCTELQLRQMLGDTISLNVLERILSRLLHSMGLTGYLPDRWADGTRIRELVDGKAADDAAAAALAAAAAPQTKRKRTAAAAAAAAAAATDASVAGGAAKRKRVSASVAAAAPAAAPAAAAAAAATDASVAGGAAKRKRGSASVAAAAPAAAPAAATTASVAGGAAKRKRGKPTTEPVPAAPLELAAAAPQELAPAAPQELAAAAPQELAPAVPLELAPAAPLELAAAAPLELAAAAPLELAAAAPLELAAAAPQELAAAAPQELAPAAPQELAAAAPLELAAAAPVELVAAAPQELAAAAPLELAAAAPQEIDPRFQDKLERRLIAWLREPGSPLVSRSDVDDHSYSDTNSDLNSDSDTPPPSPEPAKLGEEVAFPEPGDRVQLHLADHATHPAHHGMMAKLVYHQTRDGVSGWTIRPVHGETFWTLWVEDGRIREPPQDDDGIDEVADDSDKSWST